MALYAIGDVQGCYDGLVRLLAKIGFDSGHDRLWFTGDLVNRGPRSADVLRLVAGLGDRATTVLGNHDLHLLAVAAGAEPSRSRDTLDNVLCAPDREQLLGWLARRPLLHYDASLDMVLVHAGLPPAWDVATAQACAREAERVIGGSGASEFFRHMYGDKPDRWDDQLRDWERLRFIVNACTRLRYCTPDGTLDYRHNGPPGSQSALLLPWFQIPGRASRRQTVVFGHWSMLGRWDQDNVIGLDTGCVWGGELTAVRLAGGVKEFFSVACTKAPDEFA
jgi:bis(5'-nucleosyl)-tetraphosphatase (symmetrical)